MIGMLGNSETTVVLEGGALLRLCRASGVEVRRLAGRLWITQENDPGDEILEVGSA